MLFQLLSVIFLVQVLFCSLTLSTITYEAPYNCDFIEKTAICKSGNSSVTIEWGNPYFVKSPYINDYDYHKEPPYLFITCEGLNYKCDYLPKSQDMRFKGKLNISLCPPRMFKCVNDIYFPSTGLNEIILNGMKDFTREDFKELLWLRQLEIHLTDADTETIVSALPDVQVITIKGGNFHLFANMFETHQILLSLTLDSNNIMFLPDDTFNGLSTLKQLSILNNAIEHIPAAAFRGLDGLEALIINTDHRLKTIDPQTFYWFKNVQRLSLKNNSLQSLSNELFRPLEKIEVIYIKNNLVEISLGSEIFTQKTLKFLEVTDCEISVLPETIFLGSSINDINFSNNKIENLPPMLLSNTLIKTLNFKGNRIKSLPNEIFSKLKTLQYVDFSDNFISGLPSDLFISNQILDRLVLDRNNLTLLDLDLFNGLKLTTLSITSNKIHRIISTESQRTILHLDLEDNDIDVIEDWLVNATNTTTLNLSRNKIKLLKESHIYNAIGLWEFDLRHNNISSITTDILVSNDYKKQAKLATIFLSNNPIECDCPVSTLLKKWHKNYILLDFNDIICSNNESASTIKLSELCHKKDMLIGIIGSSIVGGLIILLIVITIIANRNKIYQYIRNIFNHKNIENNQTHLNVIKKYDIFISFAHQDSDLVTEHLLPRLEGDFNQKVCVHYRDWIVGELISDQIIQSVESSRFIIIILTENFIESEWSYLEFRAAKNLGQQENQAKVIVIVFDEAVTRDENLDDDFRSYILINGYIMWHDSQFWAKLKRMLLI